MNKQMRYRVLLCKCIDCGDKFEHIYQLLKNGAPKRCHSCKSKYVYQKQRMCMKRKKKDMELKPVNPPTLNQGRNND